MTGFTRRDFLGFCSAGTLAGLAGGARAIEPFKRTGKQVLKLSLAAYSLREYLTKKPDEKGAIDLLGFVDYCASLGLEGTELTSYYFPKDVTSAYIAEVKRRTHIQGLSVSGGAIGNDYCAPAGAKRDAELEKTKQWIDRYAELGAPTIRVFAGQVVKGESAASAVRNCIETLEIACEAAGKRGIMLGLENHGGITARAETMLEIVKGVKSPWLGVNFDSGNFRESDDPYAELALIAPYAVNAQVKIDMYRRGKREAETADLSRIVGILRDAGYSGWIALEYEVPKRDPYDAIPGHMDELRRIIRS